MTHLFRIEFESDVPPDRFDDWADANLLPGQKLQVFDSEKNLRVFKR